MTADGLLAASHVLRDMQAWQELLGDAARILGMVAGAPEHRAWLALQPAYLDAPAREAWWRGVRASAGVAPLARGSLATGKRVRRTVWARTSSLASGVESQPRRIYQFTDRQIEIAIIAAENRERREREEMQSMKSRNPESHANGRKAGAA